MRKWDNSYPTADDMGELDFSEKLPDGQVAPSVGTDYLKALVAEHSMGTKNKDGLYEIKDLDLKADTGDDAAVDNAIDAALNKTSSNTPSSAKDVSTSTSSFGAIGGLFARLTGSKVLTRQDLAPVLSAMKDHLMKKNVAVDIADKICEGVGDSLVGKKIGGFGGSSSFM